MTNSDHDTGAPPRLNAASVALQIADFLISTEVERLRLFRLHLQTTVRWVSPLLLDLADFESISLDHALARIRPPPNWPARPLYGFIPSTLRHSQRRRIWLRSAGSRDSWYFERTFSEPGVVVRGADHPNGRFAIRPCGPVLGFTAAVGPCLINAFSRMATLKLTEPLPEILLTSLVGRKLEQVVEHPVFSGRGYVVRRAVADPDDDLPVLVFCAQLSPFVGPWAGLATFAHPQSPD